jgi:DNA-binding transcriptional LysR family regulator
MGYSGFPNNGVMPMHGPSLAETTAFVAVVERKSFTKAAKQLALSPPRVSEMVRNLEDRLGVRLVERTTRSVAASAAGERLLARLRPALEEYQAALDRPMSSAASRPVHCASLHRHQRPIFFWPRLFRAFSRTILRFPSTCHSPTH